MFSKFTPSELVIYKFEQNLYLYRVEILLIFNIFHRGLVDTVCWLVRRKARVRAPGQTSKQNTKSISSAISSLSRLLAETLRVN